MTRISVSGFPDLPGQAGWNAILGPTPDHPKLEGKHSADVLIIGAGFAGLSAARRLNQLDSDAKIIIVDAGQLAENSAGRNSGFMIDLPHDLASDDYAGAGNDRVLIDLNRKAIEFASGAVQEYGIDKNFFDRSGKINGAAGEAAQSRNQSYANHLNSLGETSEELDGAQMRKITGSPHYHSGLYTPGTVTLQPAGYIRGLANGLVQDGVNLFCSSPVVSLQRQAGSWSAKTFDGEVSAGTVLLTVNGHLESFGFKKRQLMQLFLYAVMTPELSEDALRRLGGDPRWGITPSDPMGTSVRRIDTGQGGNRIVTRTCAHLRPGQRVGPGEVAGAARVMQKKFDARFPQLAGMKMGYAWAGHLCLTRNDVSVMRKLEEGLYSACAQNGLGTARGTLTGIGAAELAMGQSSDITKYFLAMDEPTKLPPKIVQDLAGNAYLKWKTWKARDE